MSEPIEREIGLVDLHGSVARISYDPPEDVDDRGFAQLQLRTGGAMVSASPTAKAWRELAAAALDVADALEEASP